MARHRLCTCTRVCVGGCQGTSPDPSFDTPTRVCVNSHALFDFDVDRAAAGLVGVAARLVPFTPTEVERDADDDGNDTSHATCNALRPVPRVVTIICLDRDCNR